MGGRGGETSTASDLRFMDDRFDCSRALLRSNLGQVVHTPVFLSPSSIIGRSPLTFLIVSVPFTMRILASGTDACMLTYFH